MKLDLEMPAPAVAATTSAELGEGPVWVEREQAVYWLDIHRRTLWRWAWCSGDTCSWSLPWRVGSIAARAKGGFVAGSEAGFALIDPDKGYFELLGDPEADRPGNRFNDGKAAPDGSFWAGTMDDAEERTSGALYRLAADRNWQRIDDGYHVSNGPAFSAGGGIMYHADSALRRVYRFPIDADGLPGPRETFLTFDGGDGYPDGMTVDGEDCLWIAFWDGWAVRRFSPEGVPLARIDMPVQRPTSCTFGGPDLDHLFITSAKAGLSPDDLTGQPLAGALFVIEPGVAGLPAALFTG